MHAHLPFDPLHVRARLCMYLCMYEEVWMSERERQCACVVCVCVCVACVGMSCPFTLKCLSIYHVDGSASLCTCVCIKMCVCECVCVRERQRACGVCVCCVCGERMSCPFTHAYTQPCATIIRKI